MILYNTLLILTLTHAANSNPGPKREQISNVDPTMPLSRSPRSNAGHLSPPRISAPDLVEGQVNHGALWLWFMRLRSTLTYLLNPYLTHARPCNVIDMLRRVRNCRTIIIITIIIVDIFRGADYRGQTAQWGSRQWLIRPVAFATQQYC